MGDLVLYKDASVQPVGSKLSPRYRGPFQVLHQINAVSYILQNIQSKVTFASNVGKLKPYHEPLALMQEPALEAEPIPLPAELFPVSIEWVNDDSDEET